MYPVLTFIVISLLLIGLIVSLYKASRQASVPYGEQTGNKTGTLLLWYVIGVGLAIIGTLIYAVIRL